MVMVNSDKAYKCQRCGLECGSLRKLSSHLLAEHGKEITSTSSRRVKQVKRETKTQKRNVSQLDVEHICEVCNTSFYSSKSLKCVLYCCLLSIFLYYTPLLIPFFYIPTAYIGYMRECICLLNQKR